MFVVDLFGVACGLIPSPGAIFPPRVLAGRPDRFGDIEPAGASVPEPGDFVCHCPVGCSGDLGEACEFGGVGGFPDERHYRTLSWVRYSEML